MLKDAATVKLLKSQESRDFYLTKYKNKIPQSIHRYYVPILYFDSKIKSKTEMILYSSKLSDLLDDASGISNINLNHLNMYDIGIGIHYT